MVQRVGYTATLQPATPTPDAWIDLTSISTSNYGEYGTTAGDHNGTGVWAYLKVPSSATNTRCVLRNATTGAHLDSSGVVSVTSTTGAWYFYALTGNYTTTDVAFFVYSDADADLSYARDTNIGNNIKKHAYDSNTIYDTPTTAISSWADNNHDIYAYYEYDDAAASVTTSQTESGDTQASSIEVVPLAARDITTSQTEAGDTQVVALTAFTPGTAEITAEITEVGDTQASSIISNENQIQVNIEPKAGWDYVTVTVLSTAGDLIPYSPTVQVGDQVYGETLSSAITYKKDGTVNLTSSPQYAMVNIHDGSEWQDEQPLTLTQSTRSVNITLADINESLLPSITNIEWAWYDELGPSSLTTANESGTTETTDVSAILEIPLASTSLSFGDTGTLLIESDIDFGAGLEKASGLYRVVLS